MIKFDDVTKENITYSKVPDHPYRIFIIRGSGSGKTNSLFNLISHQAHTEKFFLYANDPSEAIYQLLRERESTDLKHLRDSKAFTDYSDDMDDIEEYDPNKKCKILIVFDNMIAEMLGNKKLNPIVIKLFARGKTLNISLVFITQPYFAGPKNIKLNSTHYCIMKIQNK